MAVPRLHHRRQRKTLTTPSERLLEVMRREIRGSRLVVLQGAGHMSNLERPEEFNRAVESLATSFIPC
ncbi:MAG: alpha/beta hydrolase [Pyrinomonadaceae bacterium]